MPRAILRCAQDDLLAPYLRLTSAVFASGSTRSPRYSPAMACPGTPHRSQYHPASSAVNVVRSPWPTWRPAVTDRVIALVNAAWPPTVGSFSRSAITTRLCGAVESAEAVLLCNSVRGLRQVRRLGDRIWPEDAGITDLRARLAAAEPAFRPSA